MDDCVIIGGGPAGLAAAIYLARFRLTAALLDAGQARAALIPLCRNFPGFEEGISGSELLSRMKDQLTRYAVIPVRATAAALHCDEDGVSVETDIGPIRARKALVATGTEDKKPVFVSDQEHDRALAAQLLHYCPVCDGYEVKGRHVAVFGTGVHGAREALFLRTFANEVALVCPTGVHHIGQNERRELAEHRVRLIDGPVSPLRIDGQQLSFETAERDHTVDAVYAALGCCNRAQLAEQAGAEVSNEGIVVDCHQRTTLPHVYAAGDVVAGLNQITVAVGHAAIAATAIRNALRLPRPQ